MRSQALRPAAWYRIYDAAPRSLVCQRRFININATPASSNPSSNTINIPDPSSSQPVPDAQFEILGSPFSLLSASVSASQPLYTRKGTLVGFNGKAESAVSTLSLLEPFRRMISGVPFLYQKLSSTSPFTALISTKSPITTFTVIHLDGRVDWMVAQRKALLAWTGHTLSLKPRLNTSMSIAHWGNTQVTGRGLVCLSGKGQIYQIVLKAGEEYIVHPSNIVAYTILKSAPQPYRFKSTSMRLQVPSISSLLPDTRFFRTMRASQTYRFLANFAYTVRTWTRRSVFGDRLFLRFDGPANILIQARGNSISETLTGRDVNEIADAPAGAVQRALIPEQTKAVDTTERTAVEAAPLLPTKSSVVTVGRDGKVTFEKA